MSVVGFDFGNESCVVAVARQRGIDVVLNDESKRETPAIVSFGEKQRFVGTAGAASALMNPKNTISQIKRLIGRKFSDPELQRDLKSVPFTVTEGSDGFPLIHARYLGETKTFTPTQVLGMLFSNLKGIAEKNLNAAVVDCCIGVPVYFTDLQRRAILDAATIAGLHPLRLIHETTATALAYGIYKTDLPENEPINIAFVDVGHSCLQVCIAAFKKGQLKILAHSFDRSVGGRDFDEVLFEHFAAKFKEEYKIDVYQNARACLRLRAACEKLKKVLSANPVAPLNIECLMEEKDVRGIINREEFEQISIPILERVKKPLEKALTEAGLTNEEIHAVEVVGSGSRVPAIIKIMTDFFGKEPRRTMNASECVAKGCALECAILSPTFRVKEFQVNESFPFPISMSWKGVATEGQNGATEGEQSTVVIPKGTPIPSLKAVTIMRSGTLVVNLHYADVSELQAPAQISSYTIGPFQSAKGDRAKIKVRVRLNLHGIVSVESATLLEEEDIDVPLVKEAATMDTDVPNADLLPETDVTMQDAKGETPASENGMPESAGVSVPEAEERPVQMDTNVKADASKKKVKKTSVPVSEEVYGGLSRGEVQNAVEKEFEMALQDRVMEETKDRKNAVEAYVYDMRNKLNDKYFEFVTPSEKDEFIATLQEVEDWLYEDGEDETKSVYIAKLDDLKKKGDPIEERYKEHMERGGVAQQLVNCVNSFREAAISADPKFDHIELPEKQKVLNACGDAEAWLREKQQQQDALPKYATPLLRSADIMKKADEVTRLCRPIMTKPKPAPPKPATPEPQQPQGSEPQSPGGDSNANPSASETNEEPNPEPMDTEKPEPAPGSA
ncbi:heat shock 70 kDa protein 15-like [Silene latifolia]|uniref:heat shock 70 kDa protein 15-like n=1 Tax=Silene latifolia TaxID=37657 RepID=UPI003D771FF5